VRHCPNPDCPYRLSTGRFAEYQDEVSECADCQGPLSPGAAPAIELDEESLVTVATFSTPHEAHIARAALASHGIEGVVHHDHNPYPSASSWVQLQVAKPDADAASEVLERGPVQETTADDATATEMRAAAGAPVDDMRPARLRRRFTLARWFLYLQTIPLLLWAVVLLETPVFSVLAFLGGSLSLGTALWSKRQPRVAFGIALGFQTIVTIVAIAEAGLLGLQAVVAHLAILHAWWAAAPEPPEPLQTSLLRRDGPDVEIGDAWMASALPQESPGKPIRWARVLLVSLVVLVGLVGAGLVHRSPTIRGLYLGTTEFLLEADAGSALRQELELGRVRLAHELTEAGLSFGSIEFVAPNAIEIGGISVTNAATVEQTLSSLFPDWTIDRTPNGAYRVEIGTAVEDSIIESAMDELRSGLREEFGITIANVVPGADGRLSLEARVPGQRSAEMIHEWFAEPVMIEWRRVRYPAGVFDHSSWVPPASRDGVVAAFGGRLPPGTELVALRIGGGAELYWPLDSIPVIVGRDLMNAYRSTDEWGDPAISFQLKPDAGGRMEAATREMIGRHMALVLREEDRVMVLSAPIIEGVIADMGIIRGGFTAEGADRLARRIRNGSQSMRVTVARVGSPIPD
jgi:hypothetical protein